jgi:hypothetical protein
LQQELFDTPHLTTEDLYSNRLPARGPATTVTAGPLEYDLSDAPRDVICSADTVEVRCSVGGAPLGTFVAAGGGLIRAGVLARMAVEVAPTDLALLAVRVGVIGWPIDDGVRLRERLQRRRTAKPDRQV